jgi:predicted nucleotidyltransferase
MLQNYNILKVARVFFDEPTKEHYLKEISQKSKLAHTSVNSCLKTLINQKIITKINKKYGNRIFPIYKANYEFEEYKFYKKIDNLLRLEETKIIDKIWNQMHPRVIVLFGSYSLGEDLEESDIDIFVETKKTMKEDNDFRKNNYFNRKFSIYSKDSFNKIPERLKNNIINGIVLRGYIRNDAKS